MVKKQIVLLMITKKEKEGWHYLAVKKLYPILHGITSKHMDDFCLNCLHYLRRENEKKVCKNKDLCGIAMSS